MVNWNQNGLLLADNLIGVMVWLSLWSLSDLIIQRYSTKDKHLYMWYIGIFIVGCTLLLTLGYPSNSYVFQESTPVKNT